MSGLLNTKAVSAQSGDEAAELLQAYTATPGLAMAQNHTNGAAPQKEEQPGGGGVIKQQPR